MNDFNNDRRKKFIIKSSRPSIFDRNCTLTIKSKFNFSYFTSDQKATQDFADWTKDKLITALCNKLKDYSEKSLKEWSRTPIGKGTGKKRKRGNVFEVYGKFPKNSDFTEPRCIPHQANWARFRMQSKVRLIGFIIPEEFKDDYHPKTDVKFDCNTFYIVFLDKDHKFYKKKK